MSSEDRQVRLTNFTEEEKAEPAESEVTLGLPEGWRWAKLGDLVKTTSGGTPLRSRKEYFNGNIPWVKSGELEDNWIYDTEERITEEALKNSSAKVFPKGTLLVAMYGATVGKTAVLGIEAATNQAVCAIFPRGDLLDKLFIRYFIIWKRNELLRNSFGGAQPNISQKVIRNLRIPVPFKNNKPDIEEQRRVVARIEEITSRIEQAKKLREEALKDTEAIMQSALHQTFSNAERDYGLKTLSEICEINPSKKEIRNLSDDIEVTFVPMSAVSEVTGRIENPSTRLLRDVRKGYTYFREGDVLFAKITPCMENGKSAIAQNLVNRLGFGSTEFHVIRPSNEIIAKWVYYFIRQKSFRELAARNMTGSVGQQRVPDEFVESARIPVPPVPDQKCFVEYLDKIAAKIETLKKHQEESKEKIEVMTQAVLKRAFSGKL